MRMGKELAIAKAKMEEQEMKNDVDYIQRQKKKDAADKAELLEKIELDKKARFGDKYRPPSEIRKMMPVSARFEELWSKMRKVYMGKDEIVKTCFKTL